MQNRTTTYKANEIAAEYFNNYAEPISDEIWNGTWEVTCYADLSFEAKITNDPRFSSVKVYDEGSNCRVYICEVK